MPSYLSGKRAWEAAFPGMGKGKAKTVDLNPH
jgi:hypothetical protein